MSVSDDVIQPTSDSFWEVDCYKRTVKRHEDGHKLGADLLSLIQDRAHIEKEYAKSLKAWSKKWTELIDKGPEYGTTEAACKALMQEADRVAELHMNIKDRLNNEVQNEIKHWRNETYHKSMVGQCKETKELEDGFKKAQKPWSKLYHTVMVAKKQYHHAVKALQAVEDHSSAGGGSGDSDSASSTKSGAQKPWAKRLSRVIKTKKDYHSAMKLEKTASNQENNARNDTGVSPDQMKKLQEKAEKCRRDVESTKEKYEDALRELNSYNAKYMEDMTEVFNKSQFAEEKRLKFFKEMLYGIHKCLDISVTPEFSQIYQQLHQSIGTADDTKDLKWWSQYHGVDMPMNWPHFEEYSPEFNEISKKKMSDGSRNTVTLQRINSRYHEEFVDDYAPELHTISRKEKKTTSGGDAITLTSIKQNDTPTHVPVQQSYQNYAKTEEQPPAPLATSQTSQNRQSSYDPGLNPFGDDEEDGKDNQLSSKRNSNNGSAGDEWAEDDTGMSEVMRVPVRALYDYNGQEDDELSFKSGDVFMKLKNEDDQGWCVGEREGTVGLYPKDYVEVI